jgi:paraquat-inducible protein A
LHATALRGNARLFMSDSSSDRPAHSRAHRGVPWLLTTAFLLFGVGIFLPFFRVTKFWVFDDAISVVGGILTLFHEGEYFLFAVLSLFTLVFPCVKLGLLGIIWAEREHNLTRVRRLHRWVEQLGKWSMLDVFVVAILIVAMKSASVAQLEIGIGLYLFTFSVIATQFASALVARLLESD